MTHIIHFLDEWECKFSETSYPFSSSVCPSRSVATSILKASSHDREAPKIPFLEQTNKIAFRYTNDAVSVMLPFRSRLDGHPVFHLMLTMPFETSLEAYMADQTCLPNALQPIHGPLQTCEFYLPSFDIRNCHTDLIPALRSLGVKRAFDPYNAEFFKIHPEALYIQSVGQETLLKINAAGAEAVAITWTSFSPTVGVGQGSLPIPRIFFDHPFLFSLWLTAPVEIPLFIGAFHGE